MAARMPGREASGPASVTRTLLSNCLANCLAGGGERSLGDTIRGAAARPIGATIFAGGAGGPATPPVGCRSAAVTICQNSSSIAAWSITTRYAGSSGSSATLALRMKGAFTDLASLRFHLLLFGRRGRLGRRDGDLARLRLRGDGHAQGQHTAVELGLHVLRVESLPKHELSAE